MNATDSGPEIYQNRTTTTWCRLDHRHFDWHNKGEGFTALEDMGGGCLDAPDQLPGGAMRRYGRAQTFAAQVLITRDDATREELDRRAALAKQVVDELIAEEAHP